MSTLKLQTMTLLLAIFNVGRCWGSHPREVCPVAEVDLSVFTDSGSDSSSSPRERVKPETESSDNEFGRPARSRLPLLRKRETLKPVVSRTPDEAAGGAGGVALPAAMLRVLAAEKNQDQDIEDSLKYLRLGRSSVSEGRTSEIASQAVEVTINISDAIPPISPTLPAAPNSTPVDKKADLESGRLK